MIDTSPAEPTISRLREGLERIALVLRADLWSASGSLGLSPTQAQVLGLLCVRPAGLRANEIAGHLKITAASLTDTLSALERKGQIRRERDAADQRATRVTVTEEGRQAGRVVAEAASRVTDSLATLSVAEQGRLLRALIKIIRGLQVAGAVPVQRMCVGCRHFRPHVHPDAETPHHCEFVQAAFGDRLLRLDCGDHEPADPAVQSANWTAFDRASAPLQANQQT